MLRKAAIDRFVCPCSRPVLPEVDSLAGYKGGQKMLTIRLESIDSFALAVDPSYRKSIRLRAMREGRKCRRFDSIRLESFELIDSFALVVDPSYREGNKESR